MAPLKRAYLIIVVAFAWLISWVILGGLLASRDDANSAATIAYPLAIGGFMVGLIVGISEVATRRAIRPGWAWFSVCRGR
jgi:hypothetical protein